MKNNLKQIIILVFIFITFMGLLIVGYFTGRITMNAEGTVGNTAGNLNNGGLFCEYNGTVYFSNAYDNGCLYAMDSSEGNIRKLNSLKTKNILAGGKYLYYYHLGSPNVDGIGKFRNKSFNRSELDGKKAVSLTSDVVLTGQLVDNYVYLLIPGKTSPEFYKIKIDKSEKIKLGDFNINPASAVNGTIYYNGTEDNHYLYAFNTVNDTSTQVWKGNLWYPAVIDDYVYYMDVENNYRLCRYSISQNHIEVLTDDRVDCFNVGNGFIYYQKNSSVQPQLIGMRSDGSDPVVIAEGNYTAIHITSQYVYFKEYGKETVQYHMPLGGTYYEAFEAAKTAALETSK